MALLGGNGSNSTTIGSNLAPGGIIDQLQQSAIQCAQGHMDALRRGDRRSIITLLPQVLLSSASFIASANLSLARKPPKDNRGIQQRDIARGAESARATLDTFGGELQAVKDQHPDTEGMVAGAYAVEYLGSLTKGVRATLASVSNFVISTAFTTHGSIQSICGFMEPLAGVRPDIGASLHDALTYLSERHAKAGQSNKTGRKQKKKLAGEVSDTVRAAAREEGRAEVRSEFNDGVTTILNRK